MSIRNLLTMQNGLRKHADMRDQGAIVGLVLGALAAGVLLWSLPGCKSVDPQTVVNIITNNIPHIVPTTTTTTTTTVPPVVTPPPVSPDKPLVYDKLEGFYSPQASGIANPAFTFIKWCYGGDSACDFKNGQVKPTTAVWTVRGTNSAAATGGGWWSCPGIVAATLTEPITLTITAAGQDYVYRVAKPAVSGQKIFPTDG